MWHCVESTNALHQHAFRREGYNCWCALVQPVYQITAWEGCRIANPRKPGWPIQASGLHSDDLVHAHSERQTSLAFLTSVYSDQKSRLQMQILVKIWPGSMVLSLQLGLLFMSQVSPLLQAKCSVEASSSCRHCRVCLPWELR